MSKLFMKSTAPPIEYTEEQTQNNYSAQPALVGTFRGGQRLTIPNRKVTKLAFLLYKLGSPSGNLTFTIRRISEDALICSKLWGQCQDLPTSPTWQEVEFDDPQIINEEVRILFEYSCSHTNNQAGFRLQNTSVKENECTTWYRSAWTDIDGWDSAYRYKYYEV